MKSLLHHVALGARDVVNLAKFYERAFDLAVRRSFADDEGVRSIWLEIGPKMVLMIERTTFSRERRQGVDAGPFLLAFSCAHDEIEARVTRLFELGSELESRTEYSRYFRDPEGNRIALSSYPLEPTEES